MKQDDKPRKIEHTTHIYVARESCGCIRAMCVDFGDNTTADIIRDYRKRFTVIEQLTRVDYFAEIATHKPCTDGRLDHEF